MEDWLFSVVSAAWLALSTAPLGYMFGFECTLCCGCGDDKPRTDPKNEGTWTPSGTWANLGNLNGITWTFTENPGDNSGESWFFYGSAVTSKIGGGATLEEQQDWGNICNWYSNSTDPPGVATIDDLDKRSTTFPPETAIVHFLTPVSTESVGPKTIKTAYFHLNSKLLEDSEITATQSAYGTTHGVVFSGRTGTEGGNFGSVHGGALFIAPSAGGLRTDNHDSGTVDDGATFLGSAHNKGTINGGADFFDSSRNNGGTVNGGATFNDFSANGVAVFPFNVTVVNGGATFNDFSRNDANWSSGTAGNNFATVNGGAIFNDAACSRRQIGVFPDPPQTCTRKFVAHPTDLPTCNGTAPDGCQQFSDLCGCG